MTEKLSQKQERAARLIANGVTQAAASRDADIDVTKQTMNRWTHDETFQKRVETLRSGEGAAVQDILEGGQEKAANIIVDIVKGTLDPDLKIAKLRFDAAKYVLDMLKIKKMPTRPTPTRVTQRRAYTEEELEEMMEPIDEDE